MTDRNKPSSQRTDQEHTKNKKKISIPATTSDADAILRQHKDDLAEVTKNYIILQKESNDKKKALEKKIDEVNHWADHWHNVNKKTEEQLNHEKAQKETLQDECDTMQAKIKELNHWSHHWSTQYTELAEKKQVMEKSISWRLTAPFRWASWFIVTFLKTFWLALLAFLAGVIAFFLWLITAPYRLIVHAFKLPFAFIWNRKALKHRLALKIQSIPWLYNGLRLFGRKMFNTEEDERILSAPTSSLNTSPYRSLLPLDDETHAKVTKLSSREKALFMALRTNLEKS